MRIFFLLFCAAVISLFLLIKNIASYTAPPETQGNTAGRIAVLKGKAEIRHEGQETRKAQENDPVYKEDIVEIDSGSAANIIFRDNSTLALGENSLLTIRDYAYDMGSEKGQSFLSIARGIFIYASGMIGKTDPEQVHIETPVGSIGIRGTLFAGDIKNGQDSKITLLDGAVIVMNSGGSLDMRDKMQTAKLSAPHVAPVDTGPMATSEFANTYRPVASVAGSAFRAGAGGSKDSKGSGTIPSGAYTLVTYVNNQPTAQKPVLISDGTSVQIKAELRDASGQVTDVTSDPRTIYYVAHGRLAVSPTGIVSVTSIYLPTTDEASENDAAVTIVFSGLTGDAKQPASGALATTKVRFKIQ
jgi:hypothetical protein